MNHVMYANDICLMAPSPASLKKLIDICYYFSVQMSNLSTHPHNFVWCLSRNNINYHVLFYIWII